ncbi:MAG: sigma-70 family RNA polymerase sigma factor [Armatimonadota bacterium]
MATTAARRAEEQRALALLRRYREDGDEAARDQLIEAHTHLVDWVVKTYLTAEEPLEDLRQEGFIGLAKAVDSFDPERGVKFITYATHLIHGEIRHYLRDRKTLIRRPGWLHDLMQKMEKRSAALRQQLGREPSVPELARELNLREESLAEVLRVRDRFAVKSLDGSGNGDGNGNGDRPSFDIDRQSINSFRHRTGQLPIEDRIALEEAVQRLKYLERQVIYYLFYRDFTHAEIAEQLGTSCSNVSRVARGALKKLRRIMVAEELREAHLRLKTTPVAGR